MKGDMTGLFGGFESVTDGFGNLGELISGKGKLLLPEVHITFSLQRDQMDMGMGDLETKDGDADPLAGDSRPDCGCDLLGESAKTQICLVIESEDIILLRILGDYQSVSLGKGIDIQESVEIIVLRYLV